VASQTQEFPRAGTGVAAIVKVSAADAAPEASKAAALKVLANKLAK
jgi:hypothetical protein